VQGILAKLLESDLIDALMVPMRTERGVFAPALVTDSALLDQADPLAPVYLINSARVLGWMTQREPRARIGAVMRSCEMRAMIELVKLKQACLDCVTLISVDCAGTLDVSLFAENAETFQSNGGGWPELFDDPVGRSSRTEIPLRDACQMCERPVYDEAQIVFEFLGHDLDKGFGLCYPDEMAQILEVDEAANEARRAEVVDELVAFRTEQRDRVFAETRERLQEPADGLEGVFAACIRCHNCMTVCPICYCKTCLFKGPVFDHEPIQYIQWAERKGALRLPSDTLLFHLTRLNHMGLSCIGCGMCTSVCPVDIPVGRVFRAVGSSVQAVFDYVPGFKPEEMLPLVAFQEDELQEVGE
jgi:formate dehydrogenase subunit beta